MDKLASRGHLSFTLLLQMNGYRMEEIDLPARFRKGEGIMQPTLLSSHRRNNFLRLEEMLTPRELLATLTLSKLNFSNQASRKGGFLAGKVLMAMRAEAPQSGTAVPSIGGGAVPLNSGLIYISWLLQAATKSFPQVTSCVLTGRLDRRIPNTGLRAACYSPGAGPPPPAGHRRR